MAGEAPVIVWSLLACSGVDEAPQHRPPNVPVAAAEIHYSGNSLLLDEVELASARSLSNTHGRPQTELLSALASRSNKAAGTWIALPANATWGEARTSLLTAMKAGTEPVWIGPPGDQPAVGPLSKPPSTTTMMLDCGEEGVQVVGAGRKGVLEIHQKEGAHWISATLHLLPRVATAEGTRLAELLPTSCWRGASCAQLDDPLARSACEEASRHPTKPTNRIPLGGTDGCLLPVEKRSPSWATTLPGALDALGLQSSLPMMLIAADDTPLPGVLEAFRGLAAHGIPNPAVGLLNMRSGESLPVCDNPIRSREDISRATGTWFGNTLVPPPEESP